MITAELDVRVQATKVIVVQVLIIILIMVGA